MLSCLLSSFVLQEIDALLSGGLLTDEDESVVEEELDALIAAAVQKQLPDAPTAAENPEVELPDVPETIPGTFPYQLYAEICYKQVVQIYMYHDFCYFPKLRWHTRKKNNKRK